MSNGVEIVRVSMFPPEHGFSTRVGGVSSGRYDSLNLGGKWGDDVALVAENRRRFAAAGRFGWERLFTARQVHGTTVLTVQAGDRPEELGALDADALVSDVPDSVLGIYTADCVPILVADPDGRVAAIHAGWRGTVQGIVQSAVAALVALGAEPGRLSVAIGPSICVRCFEVGEEVAGAFDATVPVAVERRAGAKPHVDLHRANRELLLRAGVDPAAISAPVACTMCDADRFFSFRRDGGGIGHQLSFVVAGASGDARGRARRTPLQTATVASPGSPEGGRSARR